MDESWDSNRVHFKVEFRLKGLEVKKASNGIRPWIVLVSIAQLLEIFVFEFSASPLSSARLTHTDFMLCSSVYCTYILVCFFVTANRCRSLSDTFALLWSSFQRDYFFDFQSSSTDL